MIIDFHTHCFPDRLATKALEAISFGGGGIIYNFDGTADGLVRRQKESGVEKSCVMNIATSPKSMHSVNDFAISLLQKEGIVPFGSVHPDAEDWSQELDRLHDAGIKGIKLHPEFQNYYADEEKMRPVFRKISELGFVVLFHCGADYSYRPPWKCTPESLLNALPYLDTNVVAAHLGGLELWDESYERLAGLPIYMDISAVYAHAHKYQIEQIFEKHGTDRILFGTDMPWQTPEMPLSMLKSLSLTPDEMENILYRNAEKLL